jgi:hypothetical protein
VDDAEIEILEPPNKKAKTANSKTLDDNTDKLANIDTKLDEVVTRVGFLYNKLDEVITRVRFLDDIRKVFECVICRCPVKYPVVAKCCQRIVGCRACVERWFTTKSRCPMCSVSGHVDEVIYLKRIDDLVAFFRPESPDPPSTSPGTATVEEDSDDDFEPSFRVPIPPRLRS